MTDPHLTAVSVFSGRARKAHEAVAGLDATSVLRSAGAWQLGQLATLGIGSNLTALAYGAPAETSQLALDAGIRCPELTHFSSLCSKIRFKAYSLLAPNTAASSYSGSREFSQAGNWVIRARSVISPSGVEAVSSASSVSCSFGISLWAS